MQRLRFFITDVFAEKRYAGNQLATFLNAGTLSAQEMQEIAREVNFSETTFILSDVEKDGGYDVRIFAPGQELDFAGHPTLGTAYILREHVIRKAVKQVTLHLKVGQVPVLFADDPAKTVWMQQKEPVFGDELPAQHLADILNLPQDAIDNRFPVQIVSTGFPHVIVPLRTLDDLRAARVDMLQYQKLAEETRLTNILIFSPEPYADSQDISVRMFAPAIGIPEDPATGSGNGCLAGYLVEHRYLQSKHIDMRVGQGYEIGRPSVLLLRAGEKEGGIQVAVGGKVIPIAEGFWGE